MALTTVLSPKRLVTPVTSMARSVAVAGVDGVIGEGAEGGSETRPYFRTSTGWPGWRSRAAAGSVKTASTMKTSFERFSRL